MDAAFREFGRSHPECVSQRIPGFVRNIEIELELIGHKRTFAQSRYIGPVRIACVIPVVMQMAEGQYRYGGE